MREEHEKKETLSECLQRLNSEGYPEADVLGRKVRTDPKSVSELMESRLWKGLSSAPVSKTDSIGRTAIVTLGVYLSKEGEIRDRANDERDGTYDRLRLPECPKEELPPNYRVVSRSKAKRPGRIEDI